MIDSRGLTLNKRQTYERTKEQKQNINESDKNGVEEAKFSHNEKKITHYSINSIQTNCILSFQ